MFFKQATAQRLNEAMVKKGYGCIIWPGMQIPGGRKLSIAIKNGWDFGWEVRRTLNDFCSELIKCARGVRAQAIATKGN